MFPDNLTRAEARARAELIRHAGATGRDRPERPRASRTPSGLFRSRHRPSRSRGPGRRRPARGPDRRRRRARPVWTAWISTRRRSPTPGCRCTVTAGPHTRQGAAHCRYSRTGEGLHRFVDPADGRHLPLHPVRAADARRMFALLRAARPQGPIHRIGASRRGTGRWCQQRRWWLAVARSATATPDSSSPRRKPISTYLTALVAGDYHRVDARCARRAATLLRPCTVASRSPSTWTPTGSSAITSDGFGVFERALRAAVPVREVRPGLRAGVQRRRDGERRLRHPARRVRVPQPGDPRVVPGPRRHDPARALPHVVRRPGDDAVVGRPVAEGVVRHLGLQLRPQPDRRRPGDGLGRRSPTGSRRWAYRQDQLPSTHPIAADMVDLEAVEQNFDGITYSKGASVLVQLVAFVGREAFLAGCRQYFQRHAYGNTALGRPAGRPGAAPPAGTCRAGRRSGWRPPGSTPCGRRSTLDDERHDHGPFAVRAERRPGALRRCGSTGSPIGLYAGPVDGQPGSGSAGSRPTSPARGRRGPRAGRPAAAGAAAGQRRRPDATPRCGWTRRSLPRWSAGLPAGECAGPGRLLGGDLGHVP